LLKNRERQTGYIPDYKRIEKSLREKISAGFWQAGVVLPSRRDLASEYEVDVNTLQRAIAPLLKDGTLRTNGNRGTFVAGNALTFAHPPVTTAGIEPRRAGQSIPSASFSTATIGIIAAVEAEHFWTKSILHSIESNLASSAATTRFYDLHPPDSDQDFERIPLREAASALLSQGIDGLIVVGIYDRPGLTEEVQQLSAFVRVPIVFVSWHDTRRPMYSVFYDSQFAGYQAAQHLVHSGYGSFAFLAPFTTGWVEERIDSARLALSDAGLPASALAVYPSVRSGDPFANHFEEGYQALRQAVREGLSLNSIGIIAANDQTAHGILKAARELGKIAGKDFGLIGFDDDQESRSLGLTTVRPPLEALSAEASRLVLRAFEGDRTASQVRMHSRLIARSSTSSQVQRK
jgi:DNA-binding LacI/PurR family transcriptional regulator